MSYSLIRSTLLTVSLAMLSACGGGGSSTPAAQYPLDLAISDFFQMPYSYTLHATSGSDSYVLNLSGIPGSQASFHGVQAMTYRTASTETKNGATVGSITGTNYFLTTPFTELGTILSTGLTIVVSNHKPLPELAEAGASGSLDTQKYYSTSSLGTQIGTGTRTWTLTALTSDTAQFCVHDSDDVGGSPETEIDCFDLDIKGNVSAIQITFESNGQSLTFK